VSKIPIEVSRRGALRGGFLALALAALPQVAAAASGTSPDRRSWRLFKARYVTPEGRVVDTGNGGISHSEGQGYGLLLAVAADDRATFEAIWTWTQLLRRGDELFAWRWDPAAQAVTDPNIASDGEVLIAWALLRAAERWGEPAFERQALAILRALRGAALRSTDFGPVLLPGLEGFEHDGALTLNLSYWVFPALAEMARRDDPVWREVFQAGVLLIRAARFGEHALPSGWIDLEGTRVRPARGFPPQFGYNAIRIPLHLVWAARAGALSTADAEELLAPMAAWFAAHAEAPPIPALVDVQSGAVSDYGLGPGGFAISLLARFGLDATRPVRLPPMEMATDYYQSALVLLSELAAAPQDS
jgi:endoglucanase